MNYINSMCLILMSNLCHLKCGGLHEPNMSNHNSANFCIWNPTDWIFVLIKSWKFGWKLFLSRQNVAAVWNDRYNMTKISLLNPCWLSLLREVVKKNTAKLYGDALVWTAVFFDWLYLFELEFWVDWIDLVQNPITHICFKLVWLDISQFNVLWDIWF